LYFWTELVIWSNNTKIMIKENKHVIDSYDHMRNMIICKATEVFAKFGFKKTTVDDIAQALRKGKSSIYYYFKSKDEIFEAVVDKEADELRTKIIEVLHSSLNSMQKLREVIKLRLKLVSDMVNYYALLKNNDLSNITFAEKLRSKFDEEEVRIVKGILQEGIDTGVFKVKDTELSSIAIITAMKGVEIPVLINSPKADDLEKVIDDMLDILFFGLVIRNE
ncbi:MAG TPA: TetR/AcrR family transcriptional regulator, partial [Tenuifilaceae bacterium]|nr:TetR/AcrR family transcriptional regulator [Tenuifilaceae bacterium]HPE18919.1 TetR/AcrR family transcriptional regulator [Tenuifilaceae bacterium]HPQ34807.1 TetR/AcrR family transcriptional regulator [Tenuifilaceae bacterium]